jgi:hypothetical protein
MKASICKIVNAGLSSLLLSGAVNAASIVVDTVGVINPNTQSINEATGNSQTVGAFATSLTTAFANNEGGVWDMESAGFVEVSVGETITLNLGQSLSRQLVLTLSGAGDINTPTQTGEATSGDRVLGLAFPNGTRTFTPNTGILTVGIFNTDRGAVGRNPVLSVTYLDETTASTSGADADDTYFHSLSGTVENPIVSFSLQQDNFVRWDDMAIIIPEPSSALLGGIGLMFLLRRRRY